MIQRAGSNSCSFRSKQTASKSPVLGRPGLSVAISRSLLGSAGFGDVVLLGVGAIQIWLGETHQRISNVRASQVQHGLKLRCGLSGLMIPEVGPAADQVDVGRTRVITVRRLSGASMVLAASRWLIKRMAAPRG